ncbi:MAG: membrane peptidoglycan carboxypeptidase [Candidatus Paceibacteria bacterium]|jgi:membrane peptidoglycan carboxypeptidase
MIKSSITPKLKGVVEKVIRSKYIVISITAVLLLSGMWLISTDAERKYETLLSTVIYDQNGTPLSIKENSKGHYVNALVAVPEEFKGLLTSKEDRFFYYHLGINPVSSLRALYNYVTKGKAGGSSTLTQQLSKNLLGTESDRTIRNKLIEAFYSVSIEVFSSKEEILLMYANTVYLGNQVQGFGTASQAYFDKSFEATTDNERLSLLATLAYPSARNPWEKENIEYTESLNRRLTPDEIFVPPTLTSKYTFRKDSYFELATAGVHCEETCITTIDDVVTKTIREILDRHVNNGWSRNIRNGAVVVIDAKNTEVLSIVGSRNPNSESNGNQINMAIEPRPIGSTVKPFIYTKGFMGDLRPYTLVEDREYKYPIATGFSLYPKNYDGQYRGVVTLHEALSNSLNVPSVKVLEYIGLENFYAFLSDSLKFRPIQDYDSYQYGIALGGLEMDLMTLTHYFTMFPQKGSLSPIRILKNSNENFNLPPQSNITTTQKVSDEQYIELVHAIISDRFTGVNQFGLEGNLNLTTTEYGVKTGTSRDFHDSWVVGYTPDFVVGVWIGNSENEAMAQVSGSSGAGAVWHDVMEYLLTTPYHMDTKFKSSHIERYGIETSDEWTIKGDVISDHRTLLQDNDLILSIHNGDTFELRKDISIPLKARKEVTWTIDGENFGTSRETNFNPKDSGLYEISAYDADSKEREIITIEITTRE